MPDTSVAAVRGRFMWYDLMTTDPQAAETFYTKLIGWSTSPFEAPGQPPYTMWTNNEQPLGGVMDLPDLAKQAGAPPHWIAYIGTPDVDATTAEATERGGNVLVPGQDIPTVGRFAVLTDPQGAVFAVFTPVEAPPEHEGSAKPGEFSWHELATTDAEAAFDFYHALFGWNKTDAMDMGPMGTYQMYGRNGETLGGMFNKSADMPGPSAWLFYAKVDDVQRAEQQVKKLGGQILNGPMEVPGGDWVVQCMDPQGAAFALHAAAKRTG